MDSRSAERVETTDELGGKTFVISGRSCCKDKIKMDFRDAWGHI
jgi:hypothetical protein